MIIRHSAPGSSFTMIDRHIFTKRCLTDGAKVLYGYLCGLRNGADFSDKYIMKAMDLSSASLIRRKKELSEANLILVDRVSPKIYIIYIGFSKCTAQQVKEQWDNDADTI